MFDKTKSAPKAMSDLGGLQDLAADKFKATVEEVNAALPYLARVGYRVLKIEVELGLSPKVILKLSKHTETDAEVLAALLAEQADRKLLCMLLSALQQAAALQSKIQVGHFCFREVEVEVGIPPTVRMVFMESDRPESVPAPVPAPLADETMVEGPPVMETTEVETPRLPPIQLVAPGEVSMEPIALAPPAGEPAPASAEEVIRFRCPGCRVRYKVRAERAGEAIQCQRCGTALTVPHESTEPPPGHPAP